MKPFAIRKLLMEHGVAQAADMRGCADDEVQRLEDAIGCRLPQAYRDFLLSVGHGAGSLLRGTDAFYGQLPGLDAAARDLLTENGIEEELPKDAFVFYMHQGYEFRFFRLAEGDDPPVSYYLEGGGPPRRYWPTFSECLADMIRSS